MDQFIAEAKLRDQSELRDEADLIEEYHWSIRDAELKNLPVPNGLDTGVIMERHHALNWLTDFESPEWDEVTTDT